ncbi:uncharacterized protein VP01_10633g1, partial [Puccinia sorghi]
PYLNRSFMLDWADFLGDLKASFFDHNCQQRAKVALGNIRQTGTSLSKRAQGKSPAVVMSNIEFDSLQSIQAMALKAGQTIESIRKACPPNRDLLEERFARRVGTICPQIGRRRHEKSKSRKPAVPHCCRPKNPLSILLCPFIVKHPFSLAMSRSNPVS